MTPETKEIIKRMVQIRKREGLNQEKFAQILGSTRGALSMIEAFKASPSILMAIGVIKNFDTTYDWLLEGKEKSIESEKTVKSLASSKDIDALKKQIAAVLELQQYHAESIESIQDTMDDLKPGNSKMG